MNFDELPDGFQPLTEVSVGDSANLIEVGMSRRGGLCRAAIAQSRDGQQVGRVSSAQNVDWRIALLNARERASDRGVAQDAASRALLKEAVVQCETAMKAIPKV